MGKLMIEVSRKTGPLGFDTKNLPRGRDLTIFENLPRGVVILGID